MLRIQDDKLECTIVVFLPPSQQAVTIANVHEEACHLSTERGFPSAHLEKRLDEIPARRHKPS
jgi:hypothetical protein